MPAPDKILESLPPGCPEHHIDAPYTAVHDQLMVPAVYLPYAEQRQHRRDKRRRRSRCRLRGLPDLRGSLGPISPNPHDQVRIHAVCFGPQLKFHVAILPFLHRHGDCSGYSLEDPTRSKATDVAGIRALATRWVARSDRCQSILNGGASGGLTSLFQDM